MDFDTSYYGRKGVKMMSKQKRSDKGVHQFMLQTYISQQLEKLEIKLIDLFQASMSDLRADLGRNVSNFKDEFSILFQVEANKQKKSDVLKEREEKEKAAKEKKKSAKKPKAKKHSSQPSPEDFEDD